MKSRCRATLGVLACVALLVSCTGRSGSVPRDKTSLLPFGGRPNIVFVLTDDLSTNLMPFMPHVAALARRGASFSNYFVVDSLCCPSRAAIFTGQYPHNNGVYTNGGRDGGVNAFNRFGDPGRTYALALQRSGYWTGMLGKYLNRYNVHSGVPQGWNDWWVSSNGYPEYNYDVSDNGRPRHFGSAPSDYLNTHLSSQAVDAVQRGLGTGKPFAIEVAPFTPHFEYTPAPSDLGTFPGLTVPRTRAFGRQPTHAPAWLAAKPPLTSKEESYFDYSFERRVEAVQSVDRMVGTLEQTLKQQGVLDNTYFVFSSDNGYHMGDYRLRPGKQTAFDTDTRVPLIIAGPGVQAGTTIDAITQSVDLAPTFAQWSHAPLKVDPDGTSLVPLMTGAVPSAAWPQRAALIEHHGQPTPDDPDRQSVLAGLPPSYEAIRTADALYVEYVTGEREYYDLRTDPDELDNRAGATEPRTKARVAALAAWLHRLETCRGHDACATANAGVG